MSEEEDLWGDEDDALFAMVDQEETAGNVDSKDDDPFDDGEDDALMQSLLEISGEEDKIEAKDKADEDSFEALDLVPPTAQQNHFLKTNFGHSAFKPLQWRIVRSVMEERRDQCVVMATGYGKSLCYQFQAVYQDRLCIVISPLISLMEDQVLALHSNGISAAFMGSAQRDSAKVLADLKNGKINVLYVTPEFMASQSEVLTARLPEGMAGITCIAVDEAHCVSQWGHDFRSSYLQLEKLKKLFPGVPLVALTATATPHVQKSICDILRLKNPQVTRTTFNRSNLYLEVKQKCGNVWGDIVSLLEPSRGPKEARRFPGPTIIYCPTRKDVEKVSEVLEQHQVENLMYHAGLSVESRKKAHKAFLYDEVQVVVATIAFGMGIDKPDVRRVVHWGAPKDMEAYYQEIGRAGRDGLPAVCRVSWAPADFTVHRYHLASCNSEELRAHRAEMIHQMELYLGYQEKCRRGLLLKHFEPGASGASLGISRARNCCDCCTNHLLKGGRVGASLEAETADDKEGNFGEHARTLMQAVEMMGDKRGIGASVKIVRGQNDKSQWDRHKASPVYGKGKDKSDKFWTALARALVSQSLLKEVQQSVDVSGYSGKRGYSGMSVTREGYQFLGSSEPLLLPQSGELTLAKPKVKVAVVVPRFGAESLPEDSERTELYCRLVEARRRLADSNGCPPYLVVPEQTLLQMAATKPTSLANLARVSGFTDAKREKYGEAFIQEIKKYGEGKAGVKMDDFPSVQVADDEVAKLGLNTTTLTSLKMFQETKDPEKVADMRGLAASTVYSHLAACVERGVPGVPLELLGVTSQVMTAVVRTVWNKPINSIVLKLTPIKEEMDVMWKELQVDFGMLRVALAQLKREHGCSEDGRLGWSLQDYERYLAVRAGRPGLATVKAERREDNTGSVLATVKAEQREDNTGSVLVPVKAEWREDTGSVLAPVKAEPTVNNSSANTNLPKVQTPSQSKKRIPEWLSKPDQKKEMMAKKMKTNSLFK